MSADQALEHINKIGKIAGGLVGITRSDNARDQWCLTFNERSRLVNETCAMLDVKTEDEECSHTMKETGASRMQRNKKGVSKLVNLLNHFHVFKHDDINLVCLETRDVAPPNVTQALMSAPAQEAKIKTFAHDRLITQTTRFHDKLSLLKIPTLKSMHQVQSKSTKLDKIISMKNDKLLFQRLLVSKNSGCGIDLQQVLQHELSPVLLSLAEPSAKLRSANKAVLGLILQDVDVTDKLPPTHLKTCAIIDGQALVQALGRPAGAKTYGDLANV